MHCAKYWDSAHSALHSKRGIEVKKANIREVRKRILQVGFGIITPEEVNQYLLDIAYQLIPYGRTLGYKGEAFVIFTDGKSFVRLG